MVSDTEQQRAAEVMVNQVARHRHGDGLSDTAYWTQDMDRALTIAAALAAAGLLADPTTDRAICEDLCTHPECESGCTGQALADPTTSRTDERVALAVEAIGDIVGGFRVRWYDEPFEGWDGLVEPDVKCFCPGGSCYCCDGASVTREQVDALRGLGFEVVDVPPAVDRLTATEETT